jgi:hypothetical protein
MQSSRDTALLGEEVLRMTKQAKIKIRKLEKTETTAVLCSTSA